ncbi:MAG: hypothetical protein JWQ38_988 [Flavipsychrobacter sp.]|nr:hypothetical protein [Flavipsychrobacter sp.]
MKFNWTDNELKRLHDVLEQIESFKSKKIEEYEFTQIVDTFLFLIQNIPLITVDIDVKGLLRARPNQFEEVFSEESEISYNTCSAHLIKIGRFNRPNESVFYGALPTENENVSMLLTGTLESCKEIFDDRSQKLHHDLTIGQWTVKGSFMIVNLCVDDKHLVNNPRLAIATKNQIEEFKKISSPTSFALIMKFLTFISELSSLKDETNNHYYLSTALFCTIRAHYEYIKINSQKVYGLIYPSSMTQQQGLYIVLIPEAVDKFLRLDQVCMYRCKRNVEKTKSFNCFPYSDLVPVIDKKFKFSKFDESENDFSI